MTQRYLANCCFAMVFVFGLMLAASPVSAQETQEYYTYVSQWAVPRDQWAAFEKQQTADVPRMRQLVSDGTLVDWGNLTTRVHEEGGFTHAEFFTATSRANLLKALEQAWTTATNASYVSATKHADLFLHTIAHGGNTVSSATGYLRVAFYHAQRGEGAAFENVLMKDVKPYLDTQVANGTLLGYNLDEEDVHTSPPGSFNIALFFPNGATMDKFYTGLAAAQKADPAVGRMFEALTKDKDHRDGLDRMTAYQHK